MPAPTGRVWTPAWVEVCTLAARRQRVCARKAAKRLGSGGIVDHDGCSFSSVLSEFRTEAAFWRGGGTFSRKPQQVQLGMRVETDMHIFTPSLPGADGEQQARRLVKAGQVDAEKPDSGCTFTHWLRDGCQPWLQQSIPEHADGG